MQRDELGDWLRILSAPGIGSATARRLLAAFGLPGEVLSRSAAQLRSLLTPRQVQGLLAPGPESGELLSLTWSWLQSDRTGRKIVALGEAGYPQALLDTEDPPVLLYLAGRIDIALDSHLSIAVVGSRNPSAQGAVNARQFSAALAHAGLTIVSGLARGVDAAAHEGALDGHSSDGLATIAVVGTGLDQVYPRTHRQLAGLIAERGLIVSEYPLGTPALAANFPRRNRLISGLAQATLVVEAAPDSGSLITARLAVEQGKEVYAIPGSIHTPQARGCHALIRQGAKLVECARDVLEDWSGPGLNSPTSVPGPRRGSSDAPKTDGSSSQVPDDPLLQCLGADAMSLDELQNRCGLDTGALLARLMVLELDGWLVRLPGDRVQRLLRA